MDEEIFEKIFRENIAPLIEFDFPSKIAGVTHPNSDGSSRAEALAGCEVFDLLDFEHEPENPYDSKAVAVYRRDPRVQVGYLPERTAHDLIAESRATDGNWAAILHRLNRHPETGEIVGANIIVAHFKK